MSKHELSRQLPVFALLLSVLLLLASLYSGYRELQNNPLNVPANPKPLQNPANAKIIQKIKPEAISAWHLFGNPPVKASRQRPRVVKTKAVETRLKLKLMGVIATGNNHNAGAIISAPGKPQTGYMVGDKIPGNATLYAVETQRVLIKRNGQIESLSMPQPKPGTGFTVVE